MTEGEKLYESVVLAGAEQIRIKTGKYRSLAEDFEAVGYHVLAKRTREAAHHMETAAACLDGSRTFATEAELAETRQAAWLGGGPDLTRAIQFVYTNHRGETAVRTVVPKGVRWGSDEFHAEPQWLLDGWCLDRKAERSFALRDAIFSKEAPRA